MKNIEDFENNIGYTPFVSENNYNSEEEYYYSDSELDNEIEEEKFIQKECISVLNFKESLEQYLEKNFEYSIAKYLSFEDIWDFLGILTRK